MGFGGAMAIFPIFHNGHNQFPFPLTLRKPEIKTLGELLLGILL